MDKQIIIDGCDVSKCIYFQQEDDEYTCGAEECNGAVVACRACDNCYYKQLKRAEQRIVELNKTIQAKEQECEELKAMQKDLSFENQKFCYQIEELTKQLKPFKDKYFKGLDNVVIAELAKKSIRITAENSKLEQALTEIKEIAERVKVYDPLAKQILQKISECEGNDE